MDYFTGNQFPFAYGAADNSTNNNFANGFAPAGINNMRLNGAYGNSSVGVPNYCGAYNAPPQNIPMGYPGLNQPMLAGMPTSHHPTAATKGLPMANALYNAPMTYGMHPGMPMAPPRVQHPAVGFPMANGHYNAPMPNGMLPGMPTAPPRAQRPAAGFPTAHGQRNMAMFEQRSAPLVAPASLGNGVAHNALQFPAVATVPVAPAARPAEVIDLTNEEPAVAPSTLTAGTKRARGDRTSKGSAKPAKRPRYTAFGPYATPLATPVVNTRSVSTTPTLSSASPSDAEVLPATPSPSERPRVPRKRPEDPYNLRGNIYYTFMAPKNAQLEGNTRPVYSRPEGLPSTSATSKRGRKGKKHAKASAEAADVVEADACDSTSEPASPPERVEAQYGSDAEEDAVFELDEDVLAPAAATPTAVETAEAPAAEITFEAAAPAEEERDDGDEIMFDDDGNVMTDDKGQPLTLSALRAKQAAAVAPLDIGFEVSHEITAVCQKAAALNTSTLPVKWPEKDAAPTRPTFLGKKPPSQRSTVAGKKPPSQRSTVAGKKIPSQRPTVSDDDDDNDDMEAQCEAAFAELSDDEDAQPEIGCKKTSAPRKRPTTSQKKPPSQRPTVSHKRFPSKKPAAVTQHENAESAEDKRTLRELEAKFGDYRQIRIKHDFEAFLDAVYDAWQAVGCRSGPLEDRFDEMRIEKKGTAYDDWEYSEDES